MSLNIYLNSIKKKQPFSDIYYIRKAPICTIKLNHHTQPRIHYSLPKCTLIKYINSKMKLPVGTNESGQGFLYYNTCIKYIRNILYTRPLPDKQRTKTIRKGVSEQTRSLIWQTQKQQWDWGQKSQTRQGDKCGYF